MTGDRPGGAGRVCRPAKGRNVTPILLDLDFNPDSGSSASTSSSLRPFDHYGVGEKVSFVPG
jgi:hypothetical protein